MSFALIVEAPSSSTFILGHFHFIFFIFKFKIMAEIIVKDGSTKDVGDEDYGQEGLKVQVTGSSTFIAKTLTCGTIHIICSYYL